MIHYVLLAVGLVLLIKGADWLVRGASTIARILRVSEFVIGLTVVSFGTSLPELVIGLVAGAEDKPDLIIGNVVGSNIANIMLVLGIASIIHPLSATRGTVWREIPFTVLASLVLAALLNDSVIDHDAVSGLGRVDGIVLLAFFCVFLYYIAQSIRSDQDRAWVGETAQDPPVRTVLEMVFGLIGLIAGGELTVRNAIAVAEAWGMSQVFIGLTVVAVGTSLPELATSSVAAYRRNNDIAVGNVVGSNIFNIFIVLGLSCLFHPLEFDSRNNVDVALMILSTIVLFVFMFVGHPRRTIQRHEGAILVGIYAVYLVFLVMRG